jgi:NADPH:quinone reductase-like Zn-dependent oxidoreductase
VPGGRSLPTSTAAFIRKEHHVKAVIFDEIGSPAQVLKSGELPIPDIAPNEALLRMVSAPISPGDFLFIENLYPEPKKPVFPAQIGGNHGVGIVERAGAEVDIAPGTLVGFSYYNSWAEYAAIPGEWLIPLPSDFPIEKASQLFNLITAWDLLGESGLKEGDWIAVTAGYSTVSEMVLQFARQRGIKGIALVRRAHDSLDLHALGASAVIDLSALDGPLNDQVMALTGGNGLNAIIDNVGGPVTGELIRSCAFGAKVVINGGMSPDRFELHNFDVLLSGLEIKAHVYRYFFTPPQSDDKQMLSDVIEAARRSDFTVPVGGFHALDDHATAIHESINNPGNGKRFFKM